MGIGIAGEDNQKIEMSHQLQLLGRLQQIDVAIVMAEI